MINKKKSLLFFMLVFVFAFTTLYSAEPITWFTNYKEAIIAAQQDEKPIFAVFTGLSWDGSSATMKENILDNQKFMEKASKRFELLVLDIEDSNTAEASSPAKQNYFLAVRMGVQTTPALFLLTKSGVPFVQLEQGEYNDTSDSMLSLLESQQSTVTTFLEYESAIDTTEGIQKVHAIDNMNNALPVTFRLMMEPLIRQIPNLDPNNTTNLLGKYTLQIAYIDAQTYIENQDANGALECFLDLAKNETIFSAEQTQELFYTTAVLAAQSGKPNDEVIIYLQKAYDVAPDAANSEQLLDIIDQLNTNTEESN